MTETDGKASIDFLLLLQDYYDRFAEAYRADPDLSLQSYKACTTRLFSDPILYGDAYVDALRSCGLVAEQVVPFCRPLQFKWAKEWNMWGLGQSWTRLPTHPPTMQSLRRFPDAWLLNRILAKQIAAHRPKIVWVFSGIPVSVREIRIWRQFTEHLILWWSSPLVDGFPYREFDFILTGIHSLARHFERQGIETAHLPHAFDPRILTHVPCLEDRIPRVAFVGSLSAAHRERVSFLDALSRKVPVEFYGQGEWLLPSGSPLRHSYRGPAWGYDLYSVYGSHLIVIHRNIDVAGRSASAKRLFEATGMGACVVTEESEDLEALFTPNREVVTYSDLDDCVSVVKDLLDHPEKAREIGNRGQERTMRDHTYGQRTITLLRRLKGRRLL